MELNYKPFYWAEKFVSTDQTELFQQSLGMHASFNQSVTKNQTKPICVFSFFKSCNLKREEARLPLFFALQKKQVLRPHSEIPFEPTRCSIQVKSVAEKCKRLGASAWLRTGTSPIPGWIRPSSSYLCQFISCLLWQFISHNYGKLAVGQYLEVEISVNFQIGEYFVSCWWPMARPQ